MIKIGYLTSRKVILSGLALLILLSIIIKVFRAPEYEPGTPTSHPDLTMKDIVAIRMGEDGKPESQISTPRFVYYEKNRDGILEKPFIMAHTKTDSSWEIFSASGKTDRNIDGLLLTGGVTMRHGLDTPTTAIVVHTDNVLVEVDSNNARTEEPVEILLTNSTINATGMVADFNTSVIELLTNLKAEHGIEN